MQFRKLVTAIEKSEANEVKGLVESHKDALLQNKLKDAFGTTPLHLATIIGNIEIVELLLEILPKENLEAVDVNNRTALICAAANGTRKIVECLVKKNEKLVGIADKANNLPLEIACGYGHKETALYLYSATPFDLLLPQNGKFGPSIVLASIYGGMFGKTIQLIYFFCMHKYANVVSKLMTFFLTRIFEFAYMENMPNVFVDF